VAQYDLSLAAECRRNNWMPPAARRVLGTADMKTSTGAWDDSDGTLSKASQKVSVKHTLIGTVGVVLAGALVAACSSSSANETTGADGAVESGMTGSGSSSGVSSSGSGGSSGGGDAASTGSSGMGSQSDATSEDAAVDASDASLAGNGCVEPDGGFHPYPATFSLPTSLIDDSHCGTGGGGRCLDCTAMGQTCLFHAGVDGPTCVNAGSGSGSSGVGQAD
jgi:hypothetical protein